LAHLGAVVFRCRVSGVRCQDSISNLKPITGLIYGRTENL
jgi:hypothetical protein